MPMSDTSPSVNPFVITPDDANNISTPIRSFSIATAGNVKVTNADGTTPTLPLPAGVIPASVRRIWATGTTASGFVGYP